MYNRCIQITREWRKMIIKNIKLWFKNTYMKLVQFANQTFEEAWIGGKFALIGFVIIAFIIIGAYLDTGLGNGIDILFCILLGVIFIFLSGIAIKVVIRVLKDLPQELLQIIIPIVLAVTSIISLVLSFPIYLGIVFSLIIVTIESFLGIGLWLMFKRREKRILAFALVGITLAFNMVGMIKIRSTGNINNQLREYLLAMKSVQPKKNIHSPSEEGKYKVKSIFYGSGKDKNRFEYGEGVDIKTKDVYAYTFLENYIGLKSKLRTKYWGFDDKAMPINGRVYYPEEKGVFPLVLIVHGNHKMEEYSDGGYEYLGKLLASQGFIVASIDENYLNASWFGDLGGENDARAWILLKHLDTWKEFNEDKKSIFYNKVDFNNIALIGHSRGGEAVATAAAFNKLKYYPMDSTVRFNFNYNIKSIVAIAPTDGQYKPAGKPTEIKNINYLLLQGANDGDVSVFMGSNQYDRIKFDDGKYHFKSSLYIYGANHGQFNTIWGKRDIPKPMGWLLNLKTLLSEEEQRSIAKTYISAFLKSTLKEEKEYIALFKDYSEGEKFLPKTVYK
ncbi:alpha/beta hydrolase [Clostridium bovifaecis]|uniref:Alpha/beta hydrolase n=1 Tax=Clostridium bovifaecis TaxID=2184719 RepID=A0A6I6ETU6_9CLOT|nr:alpha/beta hydrolase [Clostridium bovifaecis]